MKDAGSANPAWPAAWRDAKHDLEQLYGGLHPHRPVARRPAIKEQAQHYWAGRPWAGLGPPPADYDAAELSPGVREQVVQQVLDTPGVLSPSRSLRSQLEAGEVACYFCMTCTRGWESEARRSLVSTS